MNGLTLSPATHSAADVVRLLELAPLRDEGGYFRRTRESAQRVPGSERRMASAILYLLTPEGFSALHTVDADETWCFHAGDPMEMLHLDADGGRVVRLGSLADGEMKWQYTVPAGDWQGARLRPNGRWALVSCVVVPEYREEGFVLGRRADLVARFPNWAGEIAALTR